MENSAKSYMPVYFASLERVSARLRRVSRFCETPMVNNRPAGLPGPMGRSALSHRPRAAVPVRLNPGSWHSRCRIIDQRLRLAERGLWLAVVLAMASRSRRVRPKARLVGSRWAGAAVHALTVWAALPSTFGRGTIRWRANYLDCPRCAREGARPDNLSIHAEERFRS